MTGERAPSDRLPQGIREGLLDLPQYRAGKGVAERADGLTTFKLSSNENPYPPLPHVIEAIERELRSIHRYPDATNASLIAAIADRFDVPAEHVAVGTGSVAVCGQLALATSGPGTEIVYGWRSFEAYPIWATIAHAASVQVPLVSGGRLDLEAMANAITESTSLVFVCSPNNPTGAVVSHAELQEFLDRVPEHVPVVVDEAYVEFVRDPEAADGMAVHRERPNVAVLRTFSKAYGLAALRVGFVIAPPAIADFVRRTATPFGVSSLAQAAAISSLADEVELTERVDRLVAERERVTTALTEQGWSLPTSQANFVWLPLGEAAQRFSDMADEVGLAVRVFADEGARVTIAETEANDRFIEVAARYLRGCD